MEKSEKNCKDLELVELLNQVQQKLIRDSKNIDPEFVEIVDKYFWKLLA